MGTLFMSLYYTVFDLEPREEDGLKHLRVGFAPKNKRSMVFQNSQLVEDEVLLDHQNQVYHQKSKNYDPSDNDSSSFIGLLILLLILGLVTVLAVVVYKRQVSERKLRGSTIKSTRSGTAQSSDVQVNQPLVESYAESNEEREEDVKPSTPKLGVGADTDPGIN
uniref:Uncharacterized protein n=1 Tax=Strombidium rassoulzadegani TaxID=1082188 RepID=A0A7S3FWA4_9SPIT|mmetsp:Transcript_7402/g.12502  ORF Transcript_7402/g.12502 Transcript_7402/m.12502 type:complete len:164 (+) Transcript_7402:1235-1726(+)